MKYGKRALALLTALATALLTACGGGTAETQPPKETPQEGTYREAEIPLPDGIGWIADMRRLGDGRLALLANGDRHDVAGPWTLWTSADDGKTWNGEAAAALGGEALMAARLAADGGVCGVGADRERGVYTLLTLAPGEAGPERRDLPLEEGDFPLAVERVGEDFVVGTYGAILYFDNETLWRQQVFALDEAEDYSRLTFACKGDRLYVSAGDRIEILELAQGGGPAFRTVDTFEPKTTNMYYAFGAMRPYGRQRVLLPDAEKDLLYYCDQNGIYSHADGGGLLEQIADGKGASLTLPVRKPLRMAAGADGAFFILYEQEEGYVLASYRYSEAPPAPATVLSVYKLYPFRDGRVRQTIGQFQIDHPGCTVEYRTGVSAEEMQSGGDPRDALRALNTQLVAGKGPDVFILDDMDIEPYVEKGVLLDLTDFALEHTKSGEWIASVVGNFRQTDGRIYGVPASFELPVMLGEAETVDAIGSYAGFADWVRRLRAERPGARPNESLDAGYLFTLFYPLCSRAWKDGDMDALRRFMQDTRELSLLMRPDEVREFYNDFDNGLWYKGGIELAAGSLRMVFDLEVVASMLAEGERAGKLAPLPGDRAGYYTPNLIGGVNANSPQAELARAFVAAMLSPAVQEYEFYDGLPVNRRVLERKLTEEDAKRESLMVEGDGVRFGLENAWPNPEFAAQFWAMVDGATTPAFTSSGEQELVLEPFVNYLNGEDVPLDDCMARYEQVARLKDEE